MAGALCAQHGQRRTEYVEDAEDVGVEDGAGLLVGGLLDGTEEAVARVVGDYVDAAESVHGLLDSRGHGCLVAYVRVDQEQPVGVGRLEVLQ
nr:hypothetical protein [Streptomyces sp. MBT84]